MIFPIFANEKNTAVDMLTGCGLSVCAKARPVIMSIMIAASGTLTYGVSLKKSAVIPFHTGDAANTISDHRNLGGTLTMEMSSRGVR
jgi:hypothetical protein